MRGILDALSGDDRADLMAQLRVTQEGLEHLVRLKAVEAERWALLAIGRPLDLATCERWLEVSADGLVWAAELGKRRAAETAARGEKTGPDSPV